MTLLLIEIEAGRATAAQLEEFARELHTVKGESRMFGLQAIAEACHACETLALAWKEHAPSSAVCAHVISVVDAAEGVLRAEPGAEAAALAVLDEAQRALEEAPSAADAYELVAEDRTAGSAAKAEAEDAADATDAATSAPTATAAATERWIQVSARQVDDVCEHTAQVSAEFRSLAARLRALDRADAATHRAFLEDFDRCRTQLDGLMGTTWGLRLQSIEPSLADLMRHARELAMQQGKRLRIQIQAAGAQVERSILDELWEPLVHLVRNAVDHGIEAPAERGRKDPEARLLLQAEPSGANVVLTISDDGRGIDPAVVRRAAVRRGLIGDDAAQRLDDRQATELIFQHGFSTRAEVSELSGRGVGLDVVRSVIEKLGGTVSVASRVGEGTQFILSIPTRLSLERALVVECGGALYGIPSRQVLEVTRRSDDAVVPVPGGEVVRYRDESLPYRSLAALLTSEAVEEPWLLVLGVGMRRWAIGCHSIVGEFDLLRQPLDRLLQTTAHVGGSATLDDGRLVLLLALAALVRRTAVAVAPAVRAPAKRVARILVVDDSEIIRDLVTHVLRDAGFEVQAAPDGGAALALVESNPPDAILADVEMPVMDGFELLRRVRAGWPDLPVVMLTTRSSPEDRGRSAALGANAHLVKSGFQEAALLQTVRALVDHDAKRAR